MKRAIALAGAGGSHPATLAAIAGELARQRHDVPRLVIDMSGFDSRAPVRATASDTRTLHLDPVAFGLGRRFRTAAPNLAVSGGTRRFAAMIDDMARLLVAERIGTLLVSHAWGFPEQALLHAARRLQIATVQLDEGPFSYPIRPRGAPPFAPSAKGWVQRLATAAHLLPPRDLSGDMIDLFLATSPGRGRMLLARGLAPNRMAVVPCPRFDALHELRRRWPGRPQGRTRRLLYLHQPFARDRKVARAEADRAERALASALAMVVGGGGAQVTARLHPRTDPAERERLAAVWRSLGLPFAASTAAALPDDLLCHDLAVGYYSSGLIEAAALGMPVVAASLDPAAFAEAFEGRKARAIGEVGLPVGRFANELATLIRDGLAAGDVAPSPLLLDEYLGALTGTGAAEVAGWLLRLHGQQRGDGIDGASGRPAVERADLADQSL